MKFLAGLLIMMSIFLCVISNAFAEELKWDSKEFMSVSEIKPGMIGYGKTVFQGTQIENFNIVVIGVLHKVDFGFDMILVKVTSGPVVDRKLQTVEGMSGSPIYINNRLIGAYAYGWDFQQEPIAGVTPIASMLECTQPGSSKMPSTGTLTPADHVIKIGNKLISSVTIAANKDDGQRMQAQANPSTMVMTPVATPLFVSGCSSSMMNPLQKYFAQYNMRAIPGPGKAPGPAIPLEAGSAVAVSLMDGDINMCAIGTVTYVKGNTVLAFGHPFMGTGKSDMPMSSAYVQGIVSSAQSSFKMASPVATVGTLVSDRQYAVAGELGQVSHTLPITLRVRDESRKFDQTFHARAIYDPHLTPAILYMYVLGSGCTQLADVSNSIGTFTVKTSLTTERFGTLQKNMVFAPQTGQASMLMDFYGLADTLMENPYEPIPITQANIDISYQPGMNIATIEKVIPDRLIARPGENVNFTVRIRPYGKPVETQQLTVKVPDNTAAPMMMVVIAGGASSQTLKSMVTPTPTPEEGIKGLVRWLMDDSPSQSLVSLQALPLPSYPYQGVTLNEIPAQISDLLRLGETGGALSQVSLNQGNPTSGSTPASASSSVSSRPSTVRMVQDTSYIVGGGQAVIIAIETPEQRAGYVSGSSSAGAQLPMLSTSLTSTPTPSRPSSSDVDASSALADPDDESYQFYWTTPQQQAQYTMMRSFFSPTPHHPDLYLRWPTPTTQPATPLPLSYQQARGKIAVGNELTVPDLLADTDEEERATPASMPGDAPGSGDATVTTTPDADSSTTDTPPKKEAVDPSSSDLLTKARPSWGLTSRKDLLQGTHLGTTVTSKGTLVLMPNVRSIYQTTEFLPSKLVTTVNGVYVGGWNSLKVMHLTADGVGVAVFPTTGFETGKAQTLTALVADANGNLLVATWPDALVRLISPAGALLRTWTLPVTMIWDLAVTNDGRIYAACDKSIVYLLHTDTNSTLQVGCTVPDTHVISLATDSKNNLYLATAPRGKVYKLSQQGSLSAVFEGSASTASVTVDQQGNVYVGTTPTCQIYRVAPDGTRSLIMSGVGSGNRHVLALKMIGDTLYAATGPVGGIYRITNPTGQEPEVTTIYAREDARTGNDDSAVAGPESIMVNALAVSTDGDLLAAASTPGQVLKLTHRTQGAYISPVLPVPVVTHWGEADIHFDMHGNQTADSPKPSMVTVETRSGDTALPDATWSQWTALNNLKVVSCAPGTFAQMRVNIEDSATQDTSLSYVRLFFQPVNQAPKVRLMLPTTGTFWSGKKTLNWDGIDPDGDSLVYTAAYSIDGFNWTQIAVSAKTEVKPAVPAKGEQPAVTPAIPPPPDVIMKAIMQPKSEDAKKSSKDKVSLKKKEEKKPEEKLATPTAGPPPQEAVTPKPVTPVTPEVTKNIVVTETGEKSYNWDTKAITDGLYKIKIVASDKYAKPADAKNAEFISGYITIDNTPPTCSLPEKASSWTEVEYVGLSDNLSPIIGGKYRLDGGPWIALVPVDGIFDTKAEMAQLRSPDGPVTLTPGTHTLDFMAKDAAANEVHKTSTLTIAAPAK